MLKRRRKFKISCLFLFLSLGGLLFIHGPYLAARASYFYYANFDQSSPFPLPILKLNKVKNGTNSSKNISATSLPKNSGPTLFIQKLHLELPIITGVPLTNHHLYNDALRRGVAQSADSAPLLATTGTTFIFGHSGNFVLPRSNYDTAFANLSELRKGDQVIVIDNNQEQIYQVYESKETSANDLTILSPTLRHSLTLMTCYPLGTNAFRWEVRANQED